MELREFISKTLEQIVGGIEDAQGKVTSGAVNPKIWTAQRQQANKQDILESTSGQWIHMVKFDVAVTVVEGEQTKGGVGLVVGPVVLGSTGQSTIQNTAISRIQFEVPMAYPDETRSGA